MGMGSAALKSWMGFEKLVSPAMVVAAANPVEIDSFATGVGGSCAAASRRRQDHCCRRPAAKLDSSARRTDFPARQSQDRSARRYS